MQAFQNQLRGKVAPVDPALATVLTSQAQRIIDAAQAAAPAGSDSQTDQRITRLPGGNVCVIIHGQPGSVYLIEGTDDLTTWEAVGVAEEREPGCFLYEQATGSPCRYFRSVPR